MMLLGQALFWLQEKGTAMGGLLDANILSHLGSYGLCTLSLACSWFIWQRIDDLRVQLSELNRNVAQSEATSQAHTTAFQLEMARNTPTRAEMNEAFKAALQPVRDDLNLIKSHLLEDPSK